MSRNLTKTTHLKNADNCILDDHQEIKFLEALVCGSSLSIKNTSAFSNHTPQRCKSLMVIKNY